MRKVKIPKPEPPDLVLDYVDPADPEVPAPKNSIASHASEKVNNYIATRYEITKKIEGLVPDQYGKGYWRCTTCFKIWETSPMAKECCHGNFAQVQVCIVCHKNHGQLLRIGECRCEPRKFF